MSEQPKLRKNPSREACESIIRRILLTELNERGRNEHFRQASDFMSYFESLYPASDALTKQVQRAIRSMELPKDEQGYFIINKTKSQLEQEQAVQNLLFPLDVSLHPLSGCQPLLLQIPAECTDYVLTLIERCDSLRGKYTTAVKACNGILFYTEHRDELMLLLKGIARIN